MIDRVKEFDDEMERLGCTIEKANSACRDLLYWLYLASQGRVKSTPTLGCCEEKAGKKQKKSFSKLAKRHKQMMLVASSHGNVSCTNLNPDGIEFFSQSSSLHAEIFLNSYLEAHDIDCTIS